MIYESLLQILYSSILKIIYMYAYLFVHVYGKFSQFLWSFIEHDKDLISQKVNGGKCNMSIMNQTW